MLQYFFDKLKKPFKIFGIKTAHDFGLLFQGMNPVGRKFRKIIRAVFPCKKAVHRAENSLASNLTATISSSTLQRQKALSSVGSKKGSTSIMRAEVLLLASVRILR